MDGEGHETDTSLFFSLEHHLPNGAAVLAHHSGEQLAVVSPVERSQSLKALLVLLMEADEVLVLPLYFLPKTPDLIPVLQREVHAAFQSICGQGVGVPGLRNNLQRPKLPRLPIVPCQPA